MIFGLQQKIKDGEGAADDPVTRELVSGRNSQLSGKITGLRIPGSRADFYVQLGRELKAL